MKLFKKTRSLILCCLAVLLFFSLLYYVPAVKDFYDSAHKEKLGSPESYNSVDIPIDILYENANIYATVFPDAEYAKVFLFIDDWKEIELKQLFSSTFIQETMFSLKNEFGYPEASKITIIGVDNYDDTLSVNPVPNDYTCFIASPSADKSSADNIVYDVMIYESGAVIWSGSNSELLTEANKSA